MPRPIIEIANNKAVKFTTGLQPDISLGFGFRRLLNLDIHSEPGLIELSPATKASGTDTAIDAEPLWMDLYKNGGTDYQMSYTSNGKLFYLTGGTWTLGRDVDAQGGITSAGQGLKVFDTNLYYASEGKLGKLTGTPTAGTYTDSHQTFSDTGSHPYAPMSVFLASLFVGYGRYVGKLETSSVWIASALTLPDGYVIASMTVWNEFLVIGTYNSDIAEERIFLWDGISDTFNQSISIPTPGCSALVNYNNVLLAFIGDGMYQYQGTDFEKVVKIPNVNDVFTDITPIVKPGAVDIYKELVVFGVSDIGTENTNLQTVVYSYGRSIATESNVMSQPFVVRTASTEKVQIGAVKVMGLSENKPRLFIGYDDSANSNGQHIDELNYNSHTNFGILVTQAFDVGDVFGRLIKGVRVELMKEMTGASGIAVSYRIDKDIDYDEFGGFTSLGTITPSTQDDILYGIYKSPKKIQFRFNFQMVAVDSLDLAKIVIY